MRQIKLAISWLLMLTAAHAASFDCHKAATGVEKMICADAELSQLDEKLTTVYRSALTKAAPYPAAIKDLKKTQRDWLVYTQQRCSDTACLKAAYNYRIAQLAPAAPVVAASPTQPAPAPDKRRFELAPRRCGFSLTDTWKSALSGRPIIHGELDVYVDSIRLIELPGEKTCAIMVAGGQPTFIDDDSPHPSCPDPFDEFAIWNEVSGKIEPILYGERGWDAVYPVRDTLDGHVYYLKVFYGNGCFPAGAALSDLKQVNARWVLVPAGKTAQGAFDSQCGYADKLDQCLGINPGVVDESTVVVEPDNDKNLDRNKKTKPTKKE